MIAVRWRGYVNIMIIISVENSLIKVYEIDYQVVTRRISDIEQGISNIEVGMLDWFDSNQHTLRPQGDEGVHTRLSIRAGHLKSMNKRLEKNGHLGHGEVIANAHARTGAKREEGSGSCFLIGFQKPGRLE